ncbi:hypothetical protein KFL_001040260 [Klebsormidium nitens]|uniref:Uncharacterized protein n=1 Tax=Klebsormidium nitens TaxID=105231 RepID=A0A1Y1HVN1_KLENI|nr:hypothetical protein KFL_001040260 [Klebsormidium nitens]|eukprot:GAQ82223.1 hypothetical protein KFL_001040260 [Klebsormidium nitens]
MSKAANFQYTNPLSEDPLQCFKDCLSEFAHRRNSCPTDPFASPLVSPEVSDSSTNSKLHNHEEYPPLSPRSHSLTAQVRANQVFALQEGLESQGARRRPRVYKVKCDEIRGWGLVLEENVSLLDPACHLVAVKKDGRLGLRSGLAQGRLLRCNPQLELSFVRGNLESWEAWSLRGETLSDCLLKNRRFKKELNVSIMTIGEVVDSPGNVRLTHDAVLAAEALAYPGPYVSSSAKKSPFISSGGLQNGERQGGASGVSEKVRFFDGLPNGSAEGKSVHGKVKVDRDLEEEMDAVRGEFDGAESALRTIDGAESLLREIDGAESTLRTIDGEERESRAMNGCNGDEVGQKSERAVGNLDDNEGGELERGFVAREERHGRKGSPYGNGLSLDRDERLPDGNGLDADGTERQPDEKEQDPDGRPRKMDGNGPKADGFRPHSDAILRCPDEGDVVLSDAYQLDGTDNEILVKTALVDGPVRREPDGIGSDGGVQTGSVSDSGVRTGLGSGLDGAVRMGLGSGSDGGVRTGLGNDSDGGVWTGLGSGSDVQTGGRRGEGMRAGAEAVEELRRLAAENERLRHELALEVETAAFQRSDLLRQLEKERHRTEQLQLELQQAGSGRSTPSSARRRLTFQEDRNNAASVAERVEGQLADAVARLNGSREALCARADRATQSTGQESVSPTFLQRLVAWTRVTLRTSRTVLPWFVAFGLGIWLTRLKAKRRQRLNG